MRFEELAFCSTKYWKSVVLRNEILREPLDLKLRPQDLLNENADFHLAFIDETEEVLACLVLSPLDETTIKMRQVAVAAYVQRRGFGQKLVAFAEDFALKKGFKTMTLHARISAKVFYFNMNYDALGEIFEEVGIPHQKMKKQLT